MTRRSKTTKPSSLLSELHVPLLILAAFVLGAGGMWLIMRSSLPGRPGKLPVERLPRSSATEPPDVSQLAPADAARILGNWNYDRHNWAHAIEHYQEAIADGADNPCPEHTQIVIRQFQANHPSYLDRSIANGTRRALRDLCGRRTRNMNRGTRAARRRRRFRRPVPARDC